MRKTISFLITTLLALAAWQALSSLKLWPSYLFPSPPDVALTLIRLARSGELAVGLLITLWRIGAGFVAAAVAGIALGVAMARARRLSDLAGPVVLGLQAMPSICWFPLAILWFGLNERAIMFVTVVGSLFAVATGTEAAIRTIPPTYLRAAATMGARGWRLYARVVLPASLPHLLTGLRAGWSFGWRSLMAAELLFMNLGLGHLLNMGRDLADAAQVVAIILVILAVGLTVDRLVFARAEGAVRRRWGYELAA